MSAAAQSLQIKAFSFIIETLWTKHPASGPIFDLAAKQLLSV
jgi:hypothetical protein